jgi:hypothetical protein
MDRSTADIDHFIVVGTAGLRATEMNGKREQGRARVDLDWLFGCSCSFLRLAISLRRRPPDAKATIRMALSLTSRRLSVRHVSISFAKTSPVTGLALLRILGRGQACQKPPLRGRPRYLIAFWQ